MEASRPYLLSIAGFDPSGGAGIQADIKTFESNESFGLSVCTAITFQNEKAFEGIRWIDQEDILRQLDMLSRVYPLDWVKVGLIESPEVLRELAFFLKKKNRNCKLIWDPVWRASAGFELHKPDPLEIEAMAGDVYLITPNLEEVRMLYPALSPEEGAKKLSAHANVLLKGGHEVSDQSEDLLFEGGRVYSFKAPRLSLDKHGTGCVLSSAILCSLAKGFILPEACRKAKEYINVYLNSHTSLLGIHYV